MVINKTSQPLTSTLTLENFQPAASAQVYRYSSDDLDTIVQEVNQPVQTDSFSAVIPANSITLFIIPPGTPLTPRLYLPLLVK